jgi:TldD protein
VSLSRREFLDRFSKSTLAVVTVPYLFKSKWSSLLKAPAATDWSLQDYYSHFGIDEKTIGEIMNAALTRGGEYCDIFFQHQIYNYISLEDNAVNSAYNNISYGVGIRVLKGDQTGYSYSEELTLPAMKLAAQTAASIADSGTELQAVPVKAHALPNYYAIKMPWEEIPIEKKIPVLQTINDRMFALDKRVIKCNVVFNNQTSYILLFTSEGRAVYDYQPSCFIYAGCTAEQNGQREQNYKSLAGRNGFELFAAEAVDAIARDAVQKTVVLFDAVKPEGGEMEVVLAAGSSGILLHEAIGHGMEADFNRKAISIFSDKIGKPVAQKFVTIVDDGTVPNARGSINVDDEGNDTEKTYLVENGILRSYMHDRLSARFYKVNPTGNGRRQNFRFPPQPRMRNTYMLNGPHHRDEIIASVQKGLYAETFTNGEVFIGAGDFTFYVKSGNLIENGKLTKPVKDINIIGNGPQVLQDIVMVGDDFAMDDGTWTCGKNGQGVPVSLGLPTVKVTKITVGGL